VLWATASPDSSKVLTGSADRTARLFDAQTGTCDRLFEGHTGHIFTTAFSPDGKQVLTASGDRTARLFSVETGEYEVRSGGTPPRCTWLLSRQTG